MKNIILSIFLTISFSALIGQEKLTLRTHDPSEDVTQKITFTVYNTSEYKDL